MKAHLIVDVFWIIGTDFVDLAKSYQLLQYVWILEGLGLPEGRVDAPLGFDCVKPFQFLLRSLRKVKVEELQVHTSCKSTVPLMWGPLVLLLLGESRPFKCRGFIVCDQQ